VSSKRRFRGSWRLGDLYSERPLALRPRLATGVPSSRRYLHHRLAEALTRADWTIGRGATATAMTARHADAGHGLDSASVIGLLAVEH
jgi:hypothetical protein